MYEHDNFKTYKKPCCCVRWVCWSCEGYITYEQRIALVEAVRYVDLVIPEESWDQKRSDMHEYHIDTFVMGDDWEGKFDFLKEEGVEVVDLPRMPGISSWIWMYDVNGVFTSHFLSTINIENIVDLRTKV